jgi:hypothetical protein
VPLHTERGGSAVAVEGDARTEDERERLEVDVVLEQASTGPDVHLVALLLEDQVRARCNPGALRLEFEVLRDEHSQPGAGADVVGQFVARAPIDEPGEPADLDGAGLLRSNGQGGHGKRGD